MLRIRRRLSIKIVRVTIPESHRRRAAEQPRKRWGVIWSLGGFYAIAVIPRSAAAAANPLIHLLGVKQLLDSQQSPQYELQFRSRDIGTESPPAH